MALACNECRGVIRHGEMHNCPKRLAALADLCERSTQDANGGEGGEMRHYVIVQSAVYRHDIKAVVHDEDAAWLAAEAALRKEPDTHHEMAVVEIADGGDERQIGTVRWGPEVHTALRVALPMFRIGQSVEEYQQKLAERTRITAEIFATGVVVRTSEGATTP